MKEEFDQDDLIAKYLHGTLSAAEEEALQRLKKTDKNFATELGFQEDIQQASAKLGREEIKDHLQRLEAKQYPRPKLGIRWKRLLSIAASIMIIVVAGSLFYINQQYSNNALANQYYDLPNYSGSRGEGSDATRLDQAINAFYQQDYATVISTLEPGEDASALDETSRRLLAHAYFHQQNPASVLALTSQVYNDTNLEWLTVLSHLQMNNLVEVNRQIDNILRQEQHPLRLKAGALRKQLSSTWRSFTWE